MNSPDALLARRFSDRLNQLLDQQGVPVTYHSRCTYVGRLFSGDTALGVRLLDGRSLPDWVLFTQICATFDVDPGYFLDPTHQNAFDTRAEIVVGATGGDTIVWCAPQGMEPKSGKRQLSWLSGKNLSPNVIPTDIVIFDTTATVRTLRDNTNYVLETQSGYLTKHCSIVSPGKALFSGDHDLTFIVNTESDNSVTSEMMEKLRIDAIFPVVGTMRLAKHFLPAAVH